MPRRNHSLNLPNDCIFVVMLLLLYACYICVFMAFDNNIVTSEKLGELQDLKLLQIISRHGARNPIFFYPNDPHKNYDFIGGHGQLTNLGKLQQYTLGKFLKQRYRNFLTSNPKEVYVSSSAVDRTMESAMVALAGLYPPESKWVWDRKLKWQPIPVFTTPKKDDYLLYYNPPCPAFSKEYQKLMKTEMVQTYYRDYKDFFKFLSEETGMHVKEWYELINIHSTIEIERQHNLLMPSWVTEEVLENLRMISGLAFRFLFGTKVLQRLRGGPLISEIIKNIQDKLNGSLEQRKLFFYSTHDAILAAVMNALGVYNEEPLPFTATLIVELHSSINQNFIRIFYANSSTPEKHQQKLHLLKIPECSSDCPLETFIKLTKDVVPIDVKKECLQELSNNLTFNA